MLTLSHENQKSYPGSHANGPKRSRGMHISMDVELNTTPGVKDLHPVLLLDGIYFILDDGLCSILGGVARRDGWRPFDSGDGFRPDSPRLSKCPSKSAKSASLLPTVFSAPNSTNSLPANSPRRLLRLYGQCHSCTHCRTCLTRFIPARSTYFRQIIIRATHTQDILGEKARRILELTSLVQKRFKSPENSLELYAEKVQHRGLSAIAQCESFRYKLPGGLAVRRQVHGNAYQRFI